MTVHHFSYLVSSVGSRALHRYDRGHGFKSQGHSIVKLNKIVIYALICFYIIWCIGAKFCCGISARMKEELNAKHLAWATQELCLISAVTFLVQEC